MKPLTEPPRDAKPRRFGDEMRFIRSWFAKPMLVGAVAPSGPALARTMARYVDPAAAGPVVELGPGTGPVTEALLARGVAAERLVLIEFDPAFCELLRTRFPGVTVVQGDAYAIRQTLAGVLDGGPCAAVVSSLPLLTKPLRMRVRLLRDAFTLMAPDAPFVQFTYGVTPSIPRTLTGVRAEPSERVWRNIPPARVWVYRQS